VEIKEAVVFEDGPLKTYIKLTPSAYSLGETVSDWAKAHFG